MQAITQTTYGTPDALIPMEVPAPEPAAGQILVEVHATAVTQGDRRLRAGDFPGIMFVPGRLLMGLTGPRSLVPGAMFSGRVLAVGGEVTRFQPGDEVFGHAEHGGLAEQLVIDAAGPVARRPEGLSHAEAAALPFGGVTAMVFLRDMAKVQPGERVLVIGAAGGVGRMALQVAKHLGAEVTALCSRDDRELVLGLGADHVVDRHEGDWRDGWQPYDVVLDTVGAWSFPAARRGLSERGRYLSLMMTVSSMGWMAWTALRGGPRCLTGVALGHADLMDDVRDLATSGALRPVLDARFPLQDAAAAHAHLEGARPHGDVIIEVIAPAPGRRLALA